MTSLGKLVTDKTSHMQDYVVIVLDFYSKIVYN